jgi:hypothetical protein
MSELENIVRPLQLPNNAPPPQQYVTPNQPSNPPVALLIGRAGSGRTFNETYNATTHRYLTQRVVEKTVAPFSIEPFIVEPVVV